MSRPARRVRCAGYEPHRSCENAPGPRNPYGCDRCDALRIAGLSQQFDALARSFGIDPDEVTADGPF